MNGKIVTCRNGWEKLYKPIIDKIMEYDSKQADVSDKIGIEEIKEKYGIMKIKVINHINLTDEISQMITKAERDSMDTCEFCGTKDDVGVTMNFWYKTCCKHCWENHILKNEPQSVWMNKTNKKTFKKTL